MTQDAMLARAAALLAQALETQEIFEHGEYCSCACGDTMPRRLELDILAWLDEARALGKDGV